MSGVFCPNCGKKHAAEGKFCEYCGTDLEQVILRYKQRKLPIKYQTEPKAPPYQPHPGQPIAKIQKEKQKPVQLFFRISTLLLLVALILLFVFLRNYQLWHFILMGVLGVLFIIASITNLIISPSRSTGTGCWSSDCSGCGDCGGCSCADCSSDCGGCDCGDCGGCDC